VTAVAAACVGSLSQVEFAARLRGAGLGVRIGPFDVCLRADVRGFDEPLYRLYHTHPLLDAERVFTCHLGLREIWRLRPRPGRYVRFTVDGRAPHEDLPAEQALAVFEWGLNLVIALRMHRFLMLHSAVLERHGGALALPAAPGHGKTTLCAGLAERGWRLLSDEFGLLRPGSREFLPVPRPMPLKNESIEVMRAFLPGIQLGPSIPNTRKGTVAHVRPPSDSVRRQAQGALARWLVFPRWQAGVRLSLAELPKEEAFMLLASNAFNYELHGTAGFETVRAVVDASRCFKLVYSELDEAVARISELADANVS